MPRLKVFVTRPWPHLCEERLLKEFDVELGTTDTPPSKEEFVRAMREFDAICPTVTDHIDAEILNTPGRRVKILANYGAGIDHIDLAAARSAAIAVTNTPDVTTEATSELAIMLMLMVARRASEGERELRTGNWTGWLPTHLIGTSLTNKVLGLVGFGQIAQATARRARAAFGMDIAYYSRRQLPKTQETLFGANFCATLDELVSRADILSLHCPGGPETHHMINSAVLGKMKTGSILINTARGTVVDEIALVTALRDGPIAGAGLDVYDDEPRLPAALLEAPGAVLLPHLGSATCETRNAMGMRAIDNLIGFFEGSGAPDRVA